MSFQALELKKKTKYQLTHTTQWRKAYQFIKRDGFFTGPKLKVVY